MSLAMTCIVDASLNHANLEVTVRASCWPAFYAFSSVPAWWFRDTPQHRAKALALLGRSGPLPPLSHGAAVLSAALAGKAQLGKTKPHGARFARSMGQRPHRLCLMHKAKPQGVPDMEPVSFCIRIEPFASQCESTIFVPFKSPQLPKEAGPRVLPLSLPNHSITGSNKSALSVSKAADLPTTCKMS